MSDAFNASHGSSQSDRESRSEGEPEVLEDNEVSETMEEGQDEANRLKMIDECFAASGLEPYRSVNESSLDTLYVPDDIVEEVQDVWSMMLEEWGSREAAGEHFLSLLFEAAPSLSVMFKSPKQVAAMRIMDGLGNIVAVMGNASLLRKEVEIVGFKHLDIELSVAELSGVDLL
ncbi:unnamed protein product [Durusdinium trenchii]|uniref:Uncharacterized protein n=2 Tax=Durusdinium trenchii TaxID=1381693 RepID=A0ABP0N847_9DINO